jgi:hypothetical protein
MALGLGIIHYLTQAIKIKTLDLPKKGKFRYFKELRIVSKLSK